MYSEQTRIGESAENTMSQVNGPSIPVFKITINREMGDDMGSCEKFVITPENFTLSTDQGEFRNAVPLAAPDHSSGAEYIKCAVPSCNNYFDGSRTEFAGVSHFSIPKDPELRDEWMSVIDLPSHLDIETAEVCSAHFLKADLYITDAGSQALRTDAIPRRKLCPRGTITPGGTSSLIKMANPAPTTAMSSSEPNQKQSELFPKISSVHSMSAVVTQVMPLSKYYRMRGCRTNRSAYHYQNSVRAISNPEEGLINVPATIKIPPKIAVVDLVDDASTAAGTSSDANPNLDCKLPEDDVVSPKKKRKKWNKILELEEWLPPGGKLENSPQPKDGRLPTSDGNEDSGTEKTDPSDDRFKLRNVIKPDGDHPLSNPSLLVDWSFFKSLRPFLKKMNSSQRDNLKTFILDTLNDMVYSENPSLNLA